MTQLELAKAGIISPQMEAVAQREGLAADFIRQGVTDGTIVIPANTRHAQNGPPEFISSLPISQQLCPPPSRQSCRLHRWQSHLHLTFYLRVFQ